MRSLTPSLRTAIVCATLTATAAGAGIAVSAHATPAAPLAGIAPFVPGHVLVHYATGTTSADQAALEHANGASRLGRVDDLGVEVLRVPVGTELHAIDAMKHSGKVRYAELDTLARGVTTPTDTYWSQQWGPAKVNLPQAWDTTTGAPGVVVAQLDSGVDFSHPDLSGRFVAGYDFVNGDSDPADDQGHGSSTAGILGARSNNGAGVAGACWTCALMPIKVLDNTNWGSWANISSGITYAVDHGARVISMSIGGTSGSSTLYNAVQYAANHNVLVVAAAGNDSSTTPAYPASYSGVLSVAGTDSSDHLYSWSNNGSWVDVAAPGCAYTTRLGGSYGSFCGTSASTPLVAGIAGLLLSSDPTATAGEVEQAIESSAVDIGAVVAFGRVDAAGAMAALTSGTAPAPSPSPSPTTSPSPSPTPAPATTTTTLSGSTTNKTQTRSFSIPAGTGTLDAALGFTRASSMTLQLKDADGTTLGSASGSSPAHLAVDVQAGTYTLVVSATQRANFTLTVTTPSS